MTVPASTNVLLSIGNDEKEIMSHLSSNRSFLNDCLAFLFKNDARSPSLFLLTGPMGSFLSGAAAHSGTDGIVVEDVFVGNVDPGFRNVVIIVGVMTDDMNPVETWRKVSDEMFPHKKTGVTIEVRCLVDDRQDLLSPSIRSIENVEMVAVRSLSSLAPGMPR